MRIAFIVLLSAASHALADEVQMITITTPPGQMKYDRPLIKAAPGSQLKIIFKNNDAMPHNIVFCRPMQDGSFDKGMEAGGKGRGQRVDPAALAHFRTLQNGVRSAERGIHRESAGNPESTLTSAPFRATPWP